MPKRRLRVVGLLTAGAVAAVAISDSARADNVNEPPTRTVSGPHAGFTHTSRPVGVAVDDAGRTVATNWDAGTVSVFSREADGDVTPARVLTGPFATLASPIAVDVDRNGFLFVACATSTPRVDVYAPTANGTADPVASFEVQGANGVALDPEGRVYVSRYPGALDVYGPAIRKPRLQRTIEGSDTQLSDPRGLDIDRWGRLWTADPGSGSVLAFATGANGDSAPVRRISGDLTQLEMPEDVDVDASGRIYVTDYQRDSVFVFARNADGNVAPVRTLSGVATGLAGPQGLALDRVNNLTVANWDAGSVTSHRALFPVARPGRVRAVRVSARPRAARRTVSWAAPARNGGSPVIGYRVVVRKGGHRIVVRDVPARQRRVTVPRSRLRRGTHTVSVTARNVRGAGPAASRRFVVR